MKYKKLSADCNEELFEKCKQASEMDSRTISNFIRLSCTNQANKILNEENGNTEKTN